MAPLPSACPNTTIPFELLYPSSTSAALSPFPLNSRRKVSQGEETFVEQLLGAIRLGCKIWHVRAQVPWPSVNNLPVDEVERAAVSADVQRRWA